MFLLIRNSSAFIILSKEDQLNQPTFAVNPNLHLFVHPHTLSLSTYGYAKPIHELPPCELKPHVPTRTYFYEIYKDGRCYLAHHSRNNGADASTHSVIQTHLFHPESIAIYPVQSYMSEAPYKDISAHHKQMLVSTELQSFGDVVKCLDACSREVAGWAGCAVKYIPVDQLKENLEMFNGANIDSLHRWIDVGLELKHCPLVEIVADDIPDINKIIKREITC